MQNRGNNDDVLCSAPNAIRKMNGYYLIINTEIPNLMVVDDIGKAILEMCKQKRRRQDIVNEASAELSCDKKDVEHFIDSLLAAKFLGINAPPNMVIRETELKLTGLQLHLTQACNLRCRHCFFSSGNPLEDELTDDEYMEFVKSFKNIGLARFTVSGGEPFLRRDLLFEMVKEAYQQGLERVSLSTNGTLLTEEDAYLLKKYGVKVGVSLDGGTAKVHDYIRGKGVFAKATKAIRMLREAGVYTTIGCTLMRANVGKAEEVLHLAKELGVSGVLINTVRITGRAKENIGDTFVTDRESAACLKQLWKTARAIGVHTGVEAFFDTSEGVKRANLCGAGKAMLGIASNGDVYPCDSFLGVEKLKAGSIRENSILDIWRESPTLKPFREISIEKVEGCRDCELKFICGGGCLQENYEAHGAFDKAPISCSLMKELFEEMLSDRAREMWSQQQ